MKIIQKSTYKTFQYFPEKQYNNRISLNYGPIKNLDNITSIILDSNLQGYFINFDGVSNNYLFNLLKINKYEFQESILGYHSSGGDFPYCRTKEDALLLLDNLILYYNENH